ncbi:MAG: bifunctional riboflavin kinase/FAD synthetase [Candidatus Omnitrophica bacterium]|nr:bifunctional riboflavin kinase/FAD synthetase [Candidatus Omnitrophota bacterium]
MKVIFGIGKVKTHFPKAVLAIGVFDGVHLGHQALIKKVVQKAKEIQGEAIVLTFYPHPVSVLHPEANLKLLTPIQYRLKLLEALGVNTCIVVHFTKRFAALSPERFIKRYLLKHMNLSDIFVGGDFRFGHDREGTLDYFKKEGDIFHFHVHGIGVIPVDRNHHSKISSSTIRQHILSGQIEKASKLLGRNVSLVGRVQKGDGLGKKLGFPTVNLYPKEEICPPFGVYAASVEIAGKIHDGMVYIGRRPSIRKVQHRVVVEANIFDFNQTIYGQEIVIHFMKKIRGEKKFTSPEALIQQIRKDKSQIRSFLR